jgi:hypothetical protein
VVAGVVMDGGTGGGTCVQTVSVIFEDYMIEALNMVEVYCETIVSRAQLLSAQK